MLDPVPYLCLHVCFTPTVKFIYPSTAILGPGKTGTRTLLPQSLSVLVPLHIQFRGLN